MNWEKVDSTVREASEAYRKNGREIYINRGRNPLSELIAKDPQPDMDAMTDLQLCEYAAEHHIAIAEGLSREELMDGIRSALEANWDERLWAFRGLLDYFFADGPHPLQVIRRVYAVAKAIRPQVILNMSLADLAVLCGDGERGARVDTPAGPGQRKTDGRATQSARMKRLIEAPIKKLGMKGFKSSYEKDESAVEAYSESAKDNKNRLGRDYLALNGASRGNGAATV